jgi:flagellar biosynthesis protein
MVLEKKERIAAALGYDNNSDSAPKLLAKGRGHIADKIIEVAEEHDTPVYKDERLSRQLQHLEIGETIPEDLYNVVAEVLVFISKMDARYKK